MADLDNGEKLELEIDSKKDENLKKDKLPKEQKLTKEEKKAKKLAQKEKQKAYDEWEEGISKNKRVRRDAFRKKVKRAMLVLLTFSLITTSIVYTTLLFVEENNVRITATSNYAEKSLALSMDNSVWTPYLNGKGPDYMSDITYNSMIANELHPWTKDEALSALASANPEIGNRYEDKYIAFMFMLKNTSKEGAYVACDMEVDIIQEGGIENACRVMWGTSFSQHTKTDVRVFSTLSKNESLKDLKINQSRNYEEGYLEYCSYPYTRNKEYVYNNEPFDDLNAFETYLGEDEEKWAEAEKNGYFACEPFYSDEFVFKENVELEKGEIMYCYVQIWLEGSDLECVDSITKGQVKMKLNFTVIG